MSGHGYFTSHRFCTREPALWKQQQPAASECPLHAISSGSPVSSSVVVTSVIVTFMHAGTSYVVVPWPSVGSVDASPELDSVGSPPGDFAGPQPVAIRMTSGVRPVMLRVYLNRCVRRPSSHDT